MLSASLVTSFLPASALAAPADANGSVPVSSAGAGSLPVEDMPELDTRETTIAPETLPTSGASSLASYREDEGFSLANMFSARSDEPREGEPPTEVAGTKIESLRATWRTPDDVTDNDAARLSLAPEDASQKTVQISLEAALSGQFDYDPGDISFTIPKTFLAYRDGSPAGTMKLSVPQSPSTSGMFAYVDNGDTYSVVNTKTLPAATSVLLQLEVNSIDVTRMKGDESDSGRFWCDLIVKGGESGEELVGMTNNALFATFKTNTTVKSATDTVQNLYDKYPSSFPAELKPENDGDYIYIDWYSYAHIEGNQYFDVSATASLSGFSGGTVLGMKDNTGKIHAAPAGASSFTAEIAKSAYQTGQGYYLHTYAAYPRNGLKNDVTSTFSHDISYTLTTVDTKAASSARAAAQKSYTPKEWETPVGHFGMGKRGYNTYHLALNDLVKGEDQFAYFDLKTLGFGAPFTTDKYYGTNDKIPPEELGKKSYKLVTDDYDTWFNNSTTPLTSENFEFSSMKVDKPVMYDYRLFDADGRGWTEDAEGSIAETTVPAGSYGYKATDDMSNQPLIVIEGSANGSSAYTKFGEIQWKADGTVYTKGFNGASWSGTTLTFPANVTDTRQTAETCGHGIVYMVHPTVKIKANAATIAQARSLFDNSDSPSTYVRNEAKAHALVRQYHYEGQVLVEGWRSTDDVVQGGDDTLRGAASGASLSAETTVREPSTSGNPTKDYLFSYIVQLNNQSNITDLGAYNEAVEQGYISQEMSGSWFCLLPPGVHYYKASYVGKRSGDRIVNQTVVENWRGSGRDMLIVDMSQTPAPRYYMATDYLMGKSGYADRPYISFLASMSVEDVEEFGCDTRLVAAYQSNNDEIGTVKGFRGEPNDPMFGNHHESAEAVGTYAAEMTGLSSSYHHNENGAFVYARDRSPISVNRSGVTGLQKYVSVDGGATWTNGQGDNEANVYGGQEYSYRLRNGATDDEKNVVIYDQLECAKDLGLAGTDATDATWRGKLESVDVSRMVAAGVSPVVYYSTAEGLDIDGSASDRNLSNASIWSTTPPDDMSKATAVAIDASKSRDGSDFVLKSGRSLTATVNMRAPLVTELIAKAKSEGTETTGSDWYDSTVGNTQADEEGFKGGAHALNGTTRTSTIVGGTNQKTTTSYTKVGLKPFKVELSKSWDDDSNHDGYRPASVDVDIFGNGTLAKTVTLTGEGATGDTWNKLVVDDLPYLDAAGSKISYTFTERMGDVASANYKSSIDDNEAQDAKGAMLSVAMTNTHTLDPVSAHVEKIWSDGAEGIDDYDKIRPDSVTVKICRDAGNTRYTVRTLVLSAENNWAADVDDLPQLYQGQPVSYSVWEQVPSGYRYSYTIDGASNKSVTVGPDKKHFDVAITNVHVPETRTFTFNKVWNDGNDHDKKRPGEVFVDVYANGNKLEGATVRLSADNGWTATTGSLYKNDGAGNEISYTFKERGENIYEAGSATVEQMSQGYTSAVDMSRYAAGKIEIENTHRILMSTFPIAKHWDDNGNEAGARPESVVIDVYANGKFFRQEVLTGPATAGTWEEHVSYEDLDASGNPIVYTFKEHEPVPGYYCVQEDEEIPEMTNVYYPYGNIAIEKTVENATDVSSATDFSFKVEVTHEDGTPDAGTYAWTSSDGRAGTVENGGTVSIKGGQSVTIEKAPSECSYRIEELYAPGWRATGDGYVRTGKIVPRSDNKASFTNMYSATGRVNFSAFKNVEGTDLRSSQFVFELNRVADDGSRTLVGTAYNASSGQVSFGSELYSLQDVGKTFHYQISERDTGRTGYAYDGSVFDAYVKVVDDGDGSLSGQVTYSKDGTQVDVPTFTNVYSASGTVSPSAHKVLKGQDLKDGMFSFKLIDKATGEQVGNLATNDVDGNIAFDAISYDESDAGHTYCYEMSEIAGDDETVIYSTETYLYEVKVKDNRNGTLSFDTRTYKPYATPEEGGGNSGADSEGDGSGSGGVPAEDIVEIDGAQYVEAQPVFTNDSVPGTLVLEKKVDGVAGQDYDPSAEFTFHVTLNSPGDYEFEREEKTDAWAVYTGDDKTMRFVRASSKDKAKARVAEVRGTALPSEADSVKTWTGFEDNVAVLGQWGPDNTDEIDAPWQKYDENWNRLLDITQVNTVIFVDKIKPKSVYRWFEGFSALTAVENFDKVDFSECTYIGNLFNGSSKLTYVDTTKMDVSNVEYMSSVFMDTAIKELDLSSWNTAKCKKASCIFNARETWKVTIGDKWYFDEDLGFESYIFGWSETEMVSESEGISYWFTGENMPLPCGKKDTYVNQYAVPLYAFSTDDNVLHFKRFSEGAPQPGSVFDGHTILNVVEASHDDFAFDWSTYQTPLFIFNKSEKVVFHDEIKPSSTHYWFKDFSNLTTIESLGNFNIREINDMSHMFTQCTSLQNLTLSLQDANLSNKTIDLDGMFEGCSSLESVSFEGSEMRIRTFNSMFKNCVNLTSVNLKGLIAGNSDYSKTDLSDMFYQCEKIQEVDLSPLGSFDGHGGNRYQYRLFANCYSLQKVDVSNLDIGMTASPVDSYFAGCDMLSEIVLSKGYYGYLTMRNTEYSYLPAGTWMAQSDGTEYTEKTIPSGKADTYVRKMNIYAMRSEQTVYFASAVNENAARNNLQRFDSSANIDEIWTNFSNGETTETGELYRPWTYTWPNKIVFLNTVRPQNAAQWFKSCYANEIQNLHYFDLSNATNIDELFYSSGISSLEGIKNANTSHVVSANRVFASCTASKIDISGWDLSNIQDNCVDMFNSGNITQLSVGDRFTYLPSMNVPSGKWKSVATGDEYTATNLPSNKADSYQREMAYAVYHSHDTTKNVSDTLSFLRAYSEDEVETRLQDSGTVSIQKIYTNWENSTFSYGSESYTPWYNERGVYSRDADGNSALQTVEILDEIRPASVYTFFTGQEMHHIVGLNNLKTNGLSDFNALFDGCTQLESIDLTKLDLSEARDLTCFFRDCKNLREVVGLETLVGEKVTSIARLFSGTSFKILNLSHWNTSNIYNLYEVFYEMNQLEEIDLTGWTNIVTSDYNNYVDFNTCPKLHKITVGDNFQWQRGESNSLPEGEWLSSIDGTAYTRENIPSGVAATYTKKLDNNVGASTQTNERSLFSLPNFLDPPSTNAAELGENSTDENGTIDEVLKSAKGIPIGSPFVGEQQRNLVVEQGRAANNGAGLLMGTNSSAVMADQAVMFATGDIASGTIGTCTWVVDRNDCLTIRPTNGSDGTINLKSDKWKNNIHRLLAKELYVAPNVHIIGRPFYQRDGLFRDMTELTSANVSNLDTSQALSLNYMFEGDEKLSEIDLSNWDVSNVEDMVATFHNTNISDFSSLQKWNVSHVEYMSDMFLGTPIEETGFLKEWDTPLLEDTSAMFMNCSELTSLSGLKSWDTSALCNIDSMFFGCTSLSSIDKISYWNTESLTRAVAAFSRTNIITINLNNWNTCALVEISGMFENCTSLRSANIRNWDISSLQDARDLFYGCVSLQTIDLSGWQQPDEPIMLDIDSMFYDCSSLKQVLFGNIKYMNYGSAFGNNQNLEAIDFSQIMLLDNSVRFDGESIGSSVIKTIKTNSYFPFEEAFPAPKGDSNGAWLNIDDNNHEVKAGPYSPAEIKNKWDSLNEEQRVGTWRVNHGTYTISFNTNGTDETVPDRTFGNGHSFSLPSLTQSKDNKIFVGWSSTPNGDANYFASTTYSYDLAESGQTKTLYAVWAEDAYAAEYENGTDVALIMGRGTPDATYTDDTGKVFNLNSSKIYRDVETATEYPQWQGSYDYTSNSNVKQVIIKDPIAPKSTSYWFVMPNLEKLEGIENLDTSTCENMDSMFYECGSQSLPGFDYSYFFSQLNCSNAVNMRRMFATIDIESFNVQEFSAPKCETLEEFFYCYGYSSSTKLSTVDIGQWNVPAVKNINGMFRDNPLVKEVNVDGLINESLETMNETFANTGIQAFDFSTSNTANVKSMSGTFSEINVEELDLSYFDVSSVEDMCSMFDASSIKHLNNTGWNTASLMNMEKMFMGLWDYSSSIGNIQEVVDNIQTDFVTDMSMAFGYITAPSLDLSGWNTQNVISIRGMFAHGYQLEELDMGTWDTSRITDYGWVFANWMYPEGESSHLKKIVLGDGWTPDVAGGIEWPVIPESEDYTGKWINTTLNVGPYPNDTYSTFQAALAANPDQIAGTWELQKVVKHCTLAFDANGGSGNIANMENVEIGAETTLPSAGLFCFGKTLASWNTAADGSGTSYPVGTPAIIDGVDANSTLTLYAQWADENTSIDASTGSFDVVLHPNEIVTIPNVPAGTTYTVTEKTPAGWSIVSEGTVGMSGTITTNKTSTASVKNEYTTGKTVANIQAIKKLDGVAPKYDASNESAGDIDGKFSFELFPADSSGNVTGDAIGSVKHNDLSGAVTFEPIEYTTVTNKADGDDYYYVIREQKNLPDIYDYASDVIVKVKVTDDGEGHLASTVTYNGSEEVPVMSNTSKPGSLTVSKQYGQPKSADGNPHPDTRFDFSIDLLYPDGTSETRTMQLSCGEEQTIGNLPAGTTYTVTENNLPAGWKNTLSEGTTGTIEAGSTSTARFKNIYETRPTSVVLTATKSMSDGSAMEDGKYAFDLYEIAPDTTEIPADATPVQQARATEDGDISFDMLTFDAPGTHRFAIKENLGNMDATVDYDTHAEFVDVTVTDNGEGSLVAQVSYDDDGAKFVNSHKAAHLKVSKTAIGVSDTFTDRSYAFDVVLRDASGNLLDGAYSYKVYEQGGTTGADESSVEGDAGAASDIEVSSSTVSANGTIELKSGQYAVIDLPVNTSYEITEKTPSGFVCDAQGNIGTITVADATRTIESVFTNTYFANGTVKLTASKEARGFELADNQFSFALIDEDGNMVSTAKNSLDGAIEFPSVAYTASDIGKTFVYNISEVNDGQRNIAYDNGSYSAVVTVSDNGDGTLSTDTVVVKGDVKYAEDESIDWGSMEAVTAGENVFVNSYSLAMPLSGETGAPMLAILGALLTIAGVFAIRRRSATDMGHEHTEDKNMRSSRNK